MPRVLPRLRPLLTSLAVTAAVAAVVGLFFAPDLARDLQHRRQLDAITAENLNEDAYRRALNFVALRADDRPGFRDAVINRLDGLDDARFTAVAAALDHAGVWTREHIPDAAWLRRLGGLADSPSPDARVAAAQALADLGDIHRDTPAGERLHGLLQRLVADPDPRVRLNTLTALATLRWTGPLPELTRDDHPTVARRACILLGLIGNEKTTSLTLDNLPPDLTLPAAWAMHRLAPERVTPTLRHWLDRDGPYRLAARYALEPLALRASFDSPEDALAAEPEAYRPWLTHDDPALRGVAAVMLTDRFDRARLTPLARELLTAVGENARERRLGGAVLCGVADLYPSGIVGGLSAVLAERGDFTRDQVRAMGDDELAELGLRRVDALRARAEHESDWPTRQVYRLALWMRDDAPPGPGSAADSTPNDDDDADFADFALALLQRRDVPAPTVLHALLHTGHADAALSWLFNPAGEPPVDLDDLLVRRRWWTVLDRYAPPDAPPLWPAAPAELRRFQLDVWREWVLVAAGR